MIFASKAANVLLARCRARYGKRLTAQEIDALAGCRTVADCASVLRNTQYSACLSSLGESGMYRRPFEAALHRHLMEELRTLSRCEQSVGDWFADYLLMKNEIRQLMAVVLRLSSGQGAENVQLASGNMLQRPEDQNDFSSCTDYDDLLEAARHSRFIKVLRALRPLPGNRPDSALIEHSLHAAFYEQVNELIRRHSAGGAEAELTGLVGIQMDMDNFRNIYRLKKYYNADEAAVRSMLFGPKSVTGSRVMRRMTAAADAETVMGLFLENTPYGRHINREILAREGGLEAATRLLVLSQARKLMHSSVNPSTVLLAYVFMAEAEVHDLTTIVEGVYYGLPREEILSLITINELAG